MKLSKNIINCKSCVYRNLLYEMLSSAEYEKVNASRTEIIFGRGELIINEGDEINDFLYLRKGLVKMFKTNSHGKDHILSINKPGDFINLLSIFSKDEQQYSVTALEETHVCSVKLSTILELLKGNSEFALRVMNRMSYIADEIIQKRFEISQRQVKGRVAYMLRFLSEQIYHRSDFRMPITRRELGELISMTTENTIRTMSEFRKDGIIDMDGKNIHIIDFDRLKKVCERG
ncbi:MAG: Crp/Fnr family transcriptional regulator [Chlorobi bacterium]|nr:Crp/Fnr family transcriptional regulator [Chlorobiota bacterium]